MEEEIIDIGNTVLCDLCNDDYTESDDLGGMLVGTYAVCPKCTPSHLASLIKYKELSEIQAWCPEDMPFRVFVMKLRGGNNTIKFKTYKTDKEFFDELAKIRKQHNESQ